jgi:hypothetical protein
MPGARRRRLLSLRALTALLVVVVLVGGIAGSFSSGVRAQDGTEIDSTAVATATTAAGATPPTATPEPTATPRPNPVQTEGATFVDGPLRIVVQRAARADRFEELELATRANREWVVAIVDVINFSDNPAPVVPNSFAIRIASSDNPAGFAPRNTETVADVLGIGPANAEEEILLQPAEATRLALVFLIDASGRAPAIVYDSNATPLDPTLALFAGWTDLPAVATLPAMQVGVIQDVKDGGTVVLAGNLTGTYVMNSVDVPVGRECYADVSKNRLATIVGKTVLVEPAGPGRQGVYIWLPLDNGIRVLVNQDQIITGFAASNSPAGDRFSAWMDDSQRVAQMRAAGIWGNCTSVHGVARPPEIEAVSFQLNEPDAIDGYSPWVVWSPLLLPLPNGTALAFFSAEVQHPDEVTAAASPAGAQVDASASPEASPDATTKITRRLYLSTYDPRKGAWSTAEPIAGGDLQFGIAAVVDGEGRVHAVYSERAEDRPEITSSLRYITRGANGGWSDPVTIQADGSSGHQLAPSLAVDASGALHLVWQDQRAFTAEQRDASPANADVYYSRLDAGASEWSAPVSINGHVDGEFTSRPLIALDGNRLITVWSVYTDRFGSGAAARIDWSVRATDAEGEWAAPRLLLAGRGEAFGGRLLDLESDPTGGVVFVFGRQSTDTFLFMRRLGAGKDEWSSDVLLTFGDRGSFPALTVGMEGTVYVVYNLGNGDTVDVGAVAVPRGTDEPGPEVILTTNEEGSQGRPAVAVDLANLPWVMFFSQPVGGAPDTARAIRNFIVPRSLAELDALRAAANATATPVPTATP